MINSFVQVITENQERFVQMLNDPSAGEGGQAQGGGGGGPQGEGYIQVTPQEKEAIERVCRSITTIACVCYGNSRSQWLWSQRISDMEKYK